jgi:hypothetical protein
MALLQFWQKLFKVRPGSIVPINAFYYLRGSRHRYLQKDIYDFLKGYYTGSHVANSSPSRANDINAPTYQGG